MIAHESFSFVDFDGSSTIGLWFESGCALFRPGDYVLFAEDAVAAELAPSPFRLTDDGQAVPLFGGAFGWRMSDRRAANVAEALEIATALAVLESADRAARERSLRERSDREERLAAEADRPDAIVRARAWMRAQEPSTSGAFGDRRLFIVALGIVRGFRIVSDYASLVLLEEYNARCAPPWPKAKLVRTIAWVKTHGTKKWGFLLDETSLPKPGGGSGGRGPT